MKLKSKFSLHVSAFCSQSASVMLLLWGGQSITGILPLRVFLSSYAFNALAVIGIIVVL